MIRVRECHKRGCMLLGLGLPETAMQGKVAGWRIGSIRRVIWSAC